MGEERILKRWRHAGFDCLLWTRDEGTLDGAVIERGNVLANIKITSAHEERVTEEAVEDVAETLAKPRTIWNLDPEPFTDIALAPYPGQLKPDAAPRLDKTFELAKDLHVVPGEWEFGRLIMQACDPAGIGVTPGIDLRGRPLYYFARIDAPRDQIYAWDPDGRLQLCITLSRLVRPTSIGFAYAARIIGRVEGNRFMIKPGPVRGFGADAWTSQPERDWFSLTDLQELRDVIAAFDADPFDKKSRLAQAMWWHEYACRTRLIDVRIPFVATALEALLSTSGDRSTQQFKKRVPQLAAALGLPPISNAEAAAMWALRSKLSHGEKHGGLEDEAFESYKRMEELLRCTLRRAITDMQFRKKLATRESVDAAFPVEVVAKRARCPQCSFEFGVP